MAQLSGEPYIHDPSTIVQSDGKYYTFGTGGGGLMSDDGYTWHSGAVRTGGGVAPDIIKIGDRYYVSYAVGGGGMSGGHASNVKMMWTKTLDPKSPDFGYHDLGVVASSNGIEDCDAIDPAFLYAKGHLWLSYGTYFGFIRIVELDPKTGLRVAGNKPVNVSIDMEATDMMYRDGWYYLLGTHGTCCDGANSTYNIRVGRSRSLLGPYVDNMGIPLLKGGGKLVAAASGRHYGPGHFGLLDLGDGVRSSPCITRRTWTAAAAACLPFARCFGKMAGRSAETSSRAGTYEIQSERSGFALELATDFVRIDRAGGFGGFGGPPPGAGAARRAQANRQLVLQVNRLPVSAVSCAPLPARWFRCPIRLLHRIQRTGRPETLALTSSITWSGPIRNGPSRPSPTRVGIPVRLISKSKSRAPIAPWPQPPTMNLSRCPPLPAVPNNCGASIS